MTDWQELSAALQRGRVKEVKKLVEQALLEGADPKEVLEYGLIAAMSTVGEKFSRNEVFVPEVLIAARAMKAGMEILEPALKSGDFQPIGKAVLGTVKGDMHDIGKNLVKVMFEGRGIEVIDLGVDVAPERFVDEAITQGAGVIGASALLTTTMPVMEQIVKAAEERQVRGKIKIMIGGAPVSAEFCKKIGADYYTENASEASEVAFSILTNK